MKKLNIPGEAIAMSELATNAIHQAESRVERGRLAQTMRFLKAGLVGAGAVMICASPSLAGAWTDSDVAAAVSTLDKSFIRECANDAGGTFEQSVGQRDINRDGVNELVVSTSAQGASGCVGRVGQEIDLLISDGRGGWEQNLGFDAHSLNFFDRNDSDWPDIEISGPGFCFPIWRYHEGGYGIWKTCENGNLVFAEGLRDGAVPARAVAVAPDGPNLDGQVASTALSGQASKSSVPSQPVEVVDTSTLQGGMPYMHNGSMMWVYPDKGLIVYGKPRPGIANLVKPGTVLFKGQPWSVDNTENVIIHGRAFTFRKGCEAAGYDVRGTYHHLYAIFELTFEGAAPVRRKGSCDIVGHDVNSGNSRLKLEAAWN
jgi:hypothetical protein